MKKHIIHIACFLLYVSLTYGQSIVQSPKPDRPLEKFASLSSIREVSDFSSVSLSYNRFTGNFNRPQLPSSGHVGTLLASGKQRLDKLIWKGNFSFKYQHDAEQKWNNTSLHPDEQPYLWADAGTGKWGRNHFNADVQLGSAYAGMYQWGVGLFFNGGQGNRFNDPKPLYRYRKYGITPEIAIRFNEKNWVALQLYYNSYSEDNEIGLYSIKNSLLYRLRGYGTYTRTPFVSGERQIRGQSAGANLRWVLPEHWAVQLGGGFIQGTSEEGVAVTTPGGKWKTTKAKFIAERFWRSTSSQSSLQIKGNYKETKGVDPIFKAVNARLQIAQAGLCWSTSSAHSRAFRWLVSVETALAHRLQKDLASFTEASLLRAPLRIHLQTAWKRNTYTPFASISGHYTHTLASSIETGANALAELVLPDYKVLSTNSFAIRLACGMDWKYNKGVLRVSAFAERGQAIEAVSPLFQNQFGVSLAFSPQGIFSAWKSE